MGRRCGAIVLLAALTGCAWLGEQQRRIIYRPTPSTATTASATPIDPQFYFLGIPTERAPARIALWWLPNTNPQAPTLLYLHGTFRNLEGNAHKIAALQQAGFNVLALDYRGWGGSSAITPSEDSIVADARLAWSELVRREPRASQRVLYGHSMGSGVAVELASHLQYPDDYGGLILESAFTSFADVAHEAGFWASVLALFTTERFASIDKIAQVQAPLLMLHGAQDHTVPMVLGQRLFDAAREPKQWVAIESASHSDLNLVAAEAYQRALQTFRAKHLSPTTPASIAH